MGGESLALVSLLWVSEEQGLDGVECIRSAVENWEGGLLVLGFWLNWVGLAFKGWNWGLRRKNCVWRTLE